MIFAIYLSIGFGFYLGLLFGKFDRNEKIIYGGVIETIKNHLIYSFAITIFWIFLIGFWFVKNERNRK